MPTPTPTPSPGSSQSNPVPIGTTLESQGLAVTVDSAYFDYGFANAIPRGGYKVMILGVTIENVSDQNRGYDAARFSGIDAMTGNTYNPVTLENVGVLLTDGDLQPGEYVSGTALIEVQETATNVIIKYDADIVGDKRICTGPDADRTQLRRRLVRCPQSRRTTALGRGRCSIDSRDQSPDRNQQRRGWVPRRHPPEPIEKSRSSARSSS